MSTDYSDSPLSRNDLALSLGSTRAILEEARTMLAQAQRILLVSHEGPDGDTLGSALGLAHSLQALGKWCSVGCADPVPAPYRFMPGWEWVTSTLEDEDFDLLVAVDAGEKERFGDFYHTYADLFARLPILNLDHHLTSAGCGRVNIIDPKAAATAEIVTILLDYWYLPIPVAAATCLLTGIITDTRSFEYSSTSARTLRAGARLLDCGAVPATIVKPIYRSKPMTTAQVWGGILATIGSACDGRLIWAELTQELLQRYAASEEDGEGIASYLVDIEGAEVTIFFKAQSNETTRVSIRTKAPHDASALALHFGGGGHIRAAGCSIAKPLAEAKAEVLTFVRSQIAFRVEDGRHI